jgi:hypothetical protein
MGSMAGGAWRLLVCTSCNTDYTFVAHMLGFWRCATCCAQTESHGLVQDRCDCEVLEQISDAVTTA